MADPSQVMTEPFRNRFTYGSNSGGISSSSLPRLSLVRKRGENEDSDWGEYTEPRTPTPSPSPPPPPLPIRQRKTKPKQEEEQEDAVEEDEKMTPPTRLSPQRIITLFLILFQRAELFLIGVITKQVTSKILPARFNLPSQKLTDYVYLNQKRHNEIWVGYVKYWLKLLLYLSLFLFIIFGCFSVIMRLFRATLETNTQTVNIAELLTPADVTEYIHDFATTEGFLENIDRQRRELAAMTSSDATNGQATGTTATIDDGLAVDMDGNNVTDAAEYQAANVFFAALSSGQEIEMNELGGLSISYSQRNRLDGSFDDEDSGAIIMAPLAPDLMPPSRLLCQLFSQFNVRNKNLVLKRGCYDMLWLSLDFKYNKLFLATQAAKNQHLMQQKGRQFEDLQRDFLTHVDIDRRNYAHRQQIGNHDFKCVCSAYYGITNLWAYSTYVGENSTFLIDYDIIPLLPGQESDSALRTMQNYFANQDDDPAMDATDSQFWSTFGISPVTRQPPLGIRVRTLAVPKVETIIKYYGTEYGDRFRAAIVGLAKSLDDDSNLNKDIASSSRAFKWLISFLSWIDKKVASQEDPTSTIDRINNNVMNTRANLLATRRELARTAKLQDDSYSTSERFKSMMAFLARYNFNSNPYENDTAEDLIARQPFPMLDRVESLYLEQPHSICAVHCHKLHQELTRQRQITYNRMNGFTRPMHLNPPRFAYKFVG